jgi:hypothetical protein
MSQLVIENLEFCKSSKLKQDQVQGGQNDIFDIEIEFEGAFKANPSGEAAAGAGTAVAIAIGDSDPTVLTITTAE